MQVDTLIKQFEGFIPHAYICPAGIKTIGYGHVITLGEQPKLQNITRTQADQLLDRDINRAISAVARNITTSLTPNQFAALISLTFNIGPAALQRSTLRQKINRNEHESVPTELMRWVWAGGRILPGLVTRRKAESLVYIS